MEINEYVDLMQNNSENFNKLREEENYKKLVIEKFNNLNIKNCNLKNVTFNFCH